MIVCSSKIIIVIITDKRKESRKIQTTITEKYKCKKNYFNTLTDEGKRGL